MTVLIRPVTGNLMRIEFSFQGHCMKLTLNSEVLVLLRALNRQSLESKKETPTSHRNEQSQTI